MRGIRNESPAFRAWVTGRQHARRGLEMKAPPWIAVDPELGQEYIKGYSEIADAGELAYDGTALK